MPNIFWTFFFKNDHFRYRRCRRLDRSLTVCWQTLLQIATLGLLQKQLLLSLLHSSFCLSATMKYLFTHYWLIDWNIHAGFLVSSGGGAREGGRVKMTFKEIVVSRCFNFHQSSTNSALYESWHLQLKFETSVRWLKLIVWPQEVSEVTKVKMKKILGENSKIVNFWPRKMLYTSKESS